MKVVRISALWCMSCIVMRERFEAYDLEIIDYDFDTDDVSKFQVDHILPVHIFLNDENQEIKRLEGEISKRKLKKLMEAL